MWYQDIKLGNPNVPDGVEVIGTIESMSGEITYTYFFLDKVLYKVGGWVGDKPYRVNSPDELNYIFYQFFKNQK